MEACITSCYCATPFVLYHMLCVDGEQGLGKTVEATEAAAEEAAAAPAQLAPASESVSTQGEPHHRSLTLLHHCTMKYVTHLKHSGLCSLHHKLIWLYVTFQITVCWKTLSLTTSSQPRLASRRQALDLSPVTLLAERHDYTAFQLCIIEL